MVDIVPLCAQLFSNSNMKKKLNCSISQEFIDYKHLCLGIRPVIPNKMSGFR